jgi:hypothetical protein
MTALLISAVVFGKPPDIVGEVRALLGSLRGCLLCERRTPALVLPEDA